MNLTAIKSNSRVPNLVTHFMEKIMEDAKKEMTDSLSEEKRFLAVLSEWTSIRNKRLLNVCVVNVSSSLNLRLGWCIGSAKDPRYCPL
jgi:hypothetical protein